MEKIGLSLDGLEIMKISFIFLRMGEFNENKFCNKNKVLVINSLDKGLK